MTQISRSWAPHALASHLGTIICPITLGFYTLSALVAAHKSSLKTHFTKWRFYLTALCQLNLLKLKDKFPAIIMKEMLYLVVSVGAITIAIASGNMT